MMLQSLGLLWLLCLLGESAMPQPVIDQVPAVQIHDLSLLVARDLPCVWPVGMTPMAHVPIKTFGQSAFHRDLLMIDEHTGTQWDAPAHFVPPPGSGLAGAGPNGLITGEKVPAWQFCGEACVIDISAHCDDAAVGNSYLIQPETVAAWEKLHRPLRFGDVVIFRSGYSDRYYKMFPAGDRFVATALRKQTPGWPAPTPETMSYVADRGVMTLSLDSASMGPLPDLAVATHQAGGKRGMIWNECATNLGVLPATGAFYAMLPAKHAGGSGGESRCLAVTEPGLAARLIKSSREKRVADLSVTLDEDFPVTWPGHRPGEEASRYISKTLNAFSASRGPYFAKTHLLDSMVGTHVVLPSFSLPAPNFDSNSYNAEIQASLKKYEDRYGKRGTSILTTDQAPLSHMMGDLHMVDVRELVGTSKTLPASPVITLEFIKKHESTAQKFTPGEIVVFYSGYSDSHFKPLPAAPTMDEMFVAPLAGKSEGWPVPTPEVLAYLADQGIRCVGTDGPTLGGVHPEQALFINWMAATRGLFVVEFLTNLSQVEGKSAFFIFAPIKVEGTRGGYGRALALY